MIDETPAPESPEIGRGELTQMAMSISKMPGVNEAKIKEQLNLILSTVDEIRKGARGFMFKRNNAFRALEQEYVDNPEINVRIKLFRDKTDEYLDQSRLG